MALKGMGQSNFCTKSTPPTPSNKMDAIESRWKKTQKVGELGKKEKQKQQEEQEVGGFDQSPTVEPLILSAMIMKGNYLESLCTFLLLAAVLSVICFSS